jgi:hypothetical protein
MESLFTVEELYVGVHDWMYLFNHCALKTSNEAVIECMGAVIDKHAAGGRGLAHDNYVMEAVVDCNGPTSHQCEGFLVKALDTHFEGKAWNFTAYDQKHRYLKYQHSAVIDRLLAEESKFPFLV